jgi:hypothetical protein
MIKSYTRGVFAHHFPWINPWGKSLAYPFAELGMVPPPSSDRDNKARRQLYRLVYEARETYLSHPPF